MNNFQITITGIDKASPVFRKIEKSMAQTLRPVAHAQREFGVLSRGLSIDKIAKGFRGATKASTTLARSLGGLTAPLESVFGLGVIGAIVGTGAALIGLGAKAGAAGFEVNRTSKTIGVSAEQLQLYRGIAELAGSDTETMTTAMSNLGSTLHNNLWNGDPVVQTTLDRLQMTIKKTPAGIVDTEAALIDLSRAISRVGDAHTQMNIAKVFGVEDILPVLRAGPQAIRAWAREVRDAGYVADDGALKNADEYGQSIARLKLNLKSAATIIGNELVPAVNFLNRFLLAGIDIRRPKQTGGATGSWDTGFTATGGGATGTWGDPTPASANKGGARGTPEQLAFLAKLEQQKGLPSGLLSGVWGTESSYGRNTGLSSAGASGNFQFMPGTAQQYGVTVGDFESEATGAASYLKDLYQQRGSWPAALYGYNGVRNNTDKGEKYVRDVATNSAAAQTLKVELAISGAPLGMRATAKASDGAFVPTRINYSMPLEGTP